MSTAATQPSDWPNVQPCEAPVGLTRPIEMIEARLRCVAPVSPGLCLRSRVLTRRSQPNDLSWKVKPWCFVWERLDPVTYADFDDDEVREFARTWLRARGVTLS